MRFVNAFHNAFHPARWLGVVLLASLAACAARGPAASSVPPRPGSSRQALLRQVAARSLTLPVVASPDSVVSSGGVLNAMLVAEPGTYTLGGDTFTANVYNGSYVPPTLVMSPGDSIALRLINGLDYNGWLPDTAAVTNLHYHGFNVTPLPPGDDVLMDIPNEQEFSYAFRMPSWHRPGLYWYHPHPHGISEGQVTGGMSGAMVVRGLIESYFPQFAGIPEVVMLLKDHVPTGDPDGAKIKSINGQTSSQIQIQPGEAQLWRFGNVGADAYYNLKLVDVNEVPQPMLVLARDGSPVAVGGLYVDSLFLPPSSRYEVVVQGGPEQLYLISDSIATGPDGDPNPWVLLATVGTGQGGSPPAPLPVNVSPAQQALLDTINAVLADSVGANHRTFAFSEDTSSNTFFINNVMYDPNRVDTQIAVPTTEVWTLQNKSREVHVFHIHQGDFLVTAINGVPQPVTGFVDTVNLPYSEDGVTPTTVTIVIPFHNLGAVGEFVYHCHILEHEDGGMMQNIVLYPAGTQPPARRPRAHAGH